MKIEINSKYNIGNVVKKYETVGEYKGRIICPLCNGKHFVDNPKYDPYDDNFENSNLECPHCNEDGYILTNYVTEKVLGKELYRIEDIYVSINKDGNIKYTYGLHSNPKLNNRSYGYCSCNASEEDLELIRNG